MPKHQQTQEIIPSPSVETSVAESLNTPFFCLGDWPQQTWWELFNSSQLNALIEEALAQNPSIQEVERRVEFAWQTAKIARARLFPTIFFRAKDSWEYLSRNGLYRALNPNVPLSATLIDIDFTLDYEFDFWGKNQHRFLAALGEERFQNARAAQVRIVITTALAQAYFTLKADLLRKHLYKQFLEVRENIYKVQATLKEKALLSIAPLLISEEKLLEAKKKLFEIDKEIALDKHLINVLAGTGPDVCLDIDEELPSLPECLALPECLSLDLLARRPDLMAQIWRVEGLAHEVGAAIADFFPNVNLSAFLGLESVTYAHLFDVGSLTGGVTSALHLPIFTAGAIAANVKAKKALFEEAVFQYNQLLLTSAQEVADALSFAKSIFYQKEQQEQIVENAQKLKELVLVLKQKGLDNILQGYSADEELILKELDNVALLYGQYIATIKLIKALGGGYYADYIPLQADENCP